MLNSSPPRSWQYLRASVWFRLSNGRSTQVREFRSMRSSAHSKGYNFCCRGVMGSLMGEPPSLAEIQSKSQTVPPQLYSVNAPNIISLLHAPSRTQAPSIRLKPVLQVQFPWTKAAFSRQQLTPSGCRTCVVAFVQRHLLFFGFLAAFSLHAVSSEWQTKASTKSGG